MDYRDHNSGLTGDFFWFRAKRDLIRILMDRLAPKSNRSILNIGSGTGEDIRIIGQHGDVHAVDIEPRALELIPKDLVIEKKVGDLCDLPYPDGHFDIVVAFDVLEHIENDRKAADEIFRVLSEGGFLVLTVPAYQRLFSSHDRHLGHYRRYSKSSLGSLLARFETVDMGYWMSLLFPPVATKRLIFSRKDISTPDRMPSKGLLNSILYRILSAENRIIRAGLHFPFGLTVYGIFKKGPREN